VVGLGRANTIHYKKTVFLLRRILKNNITKPSAKMSTLQLSAYGVIIYGKNEIIHFLFILFATNRVL